MITIYHNPRCRKSRETLKLLEENGVTPEVVEYLKTPLDKNQLSELVHKLGIKPSELIRKGESDYKENYKGQNLSDNDWLEAMEKYPKLMERPIVVNGDKAAVGRPPENVLSVI